MPIYYKKVTPDGADLNLVESGLGSSGGGSASGFFNFGSMPKKLSNNFGGSRSNGFGGDGEVELERISCSFNNHPNDDQEYDRSQFLLSKTSNADRDRLMTKFGPIVVVKQFPESHQLTEPNNDLVDNGAQTNGNTQPPPAPRPVIITYHDIGLNYFSNFESFFTRIQVKHLLQDFRIYHLNAPGQEENAEDLSSNYLFPTMDELAEQLGEVCRFYNIKEFIGFGYGAGANVLSRFALSNQDMVEALFLINPSATTSTWSEWFYQKLNLRNLYNPAVGATNGSANNSSANGTNGSIYSGSNSTMSPVPNPDLPQTVQDYFIWHLFGNINVPDRVVDDEAVSFYRRYFDSGVINKTNLARFIESFLGRSALGISRDDRLNNFKCPVAVVCGDYSPHIDESVKMNSRLDPTNSTWMKLSDASMILEEQPNKVTEVLRLFLQGLGYTLKKALRQERSFLSGKSMPCLAYYQRTGITSSASSGNANQATATINVTGTSSTYDGSSFRRSTCAGLNQV